MGEKKRNDLKIAGRGVHWGFVPIAKGWTRDKKGYEKGIRKSGEKCESKKAEKVPKGNKVMLRGGGGVSSILNRRGGGRSRLTWPRKGNH